MDVGLRYLVSSNAVVIGQRLVHRRADVDDTFERSFSAPVSHHRHVLSAYFLFFLRKNVIISKRASFQPNGVYAAEST